VQTAYRVRQALPFGQDRRGGQSAREPNGGKRGTYTGLQPRMGERAEAVAGGGSSRVRYDPPANEFRGQDMETVLL